jgi:hypothetical protein
MQRMIYEGRKCTDEGNIQMICAVIKAKDPEDCRMKG